MDCKHEIEKGEALFAKGQIDQAQATFELVLQNQPENHEALNNLGVIHHTRGNVQEAEDHFFKAIEAKEDYLDALLNLADLYQNTKRWEEAALQLEKCTAIDNQDPNLLNQLGMVYLEMGNTEKARGVLAISLDLNPDQEAVRDSLKALENKREAPKIEVSGKPLNILFVQESPCIRNYKMATALRSRGHKVSLAYTKAKLSQMYKGLSDDVYNECIQLQSHRHLWDISKNYDIVHCHNEPDILTVAALAGDAPVVHDTHDLISLRANGDPNLTYFEGVANRGAAGRVYTTPYQLEEAKRLYGVNGPSLVFFNYASEADLPSKFLPKLSDQDGNVHIVYEGGIGGNTHRDFSSLFVDLAKEGIHIHIYPTFYNQEISQYFSSHKTIHYYHPLSPKQIMEEMTQYDFGIIPFNLEKGNKQFLDSTIANKLFEYLAAGLPVIASPLKTYVDYFSKNRVGITYNTPEDIIDNIPILKEIASTTDFSKKIFTYEREIERLYAFYKEILEPRTEKQKTHEVKQVSSEHYIQNACDRLIAWIDGNGWEGYDPYDIQDYFIQKAKKGKVVPPEKQNEILQKANIYPIKIREELGIEKKRNAKALGLLASARVRLYKVTNEKHHLEEAERLADWLLNNPSEGYENLCWGYPFDWQSVIFIPKGTPSAVVSTVVGDGLWELYTVTRKETYLNACESVCRFITKSLRMDDMGDKGVCFSYTPIDDYHVHNANLFCGEFLARIGKEVENEEWLELAERTADYAISEQNKDGSIFYWGRIQNQYAPNKLDHYHSGFEIRCLFKLVQHLKLDKIRSAYEKYLNFYLQNFFLPDGTPKITPQKPYPVNIHGAAESILALSMFSKEHGELFEMARRSLSWTINHMQMSEGWFGYLWAPQGRVDAPLLRWGQAWMLRAFAEYFVAEKILSREWGYYSKLTNTPGRKATITSSARRDQELEELKDLALSYAKLGKGKIPLHVIKAMADKIDGDLPLEEKQRRVLESIAQPEKWQQLIDRTPKPLTTAGADRNQSNLDYQIMMPDTGQLPYGSKEWAEALFKNSETDPWGHDWRASQKARYEAALELVKQYIPPGLPVNTIDIGCALGHFTKMLKGYFSNSEMLGVDISEEAVQKCRNKYNNIQFEVSSLPELKLPKSRFDFVSALEVIYYVGENNIDQSLKRIYDVMANGSYLLISTYLNKPPFITSEKFKKTLSKYFEVIDETFRYHVLYSQYETMIRQSMDAVTKLSQISTTQSNSNVSNFVQSGIRILGDVSLMNQINKYTKDNIGGKGISHSIILAQKK